jgi:hypothetical protein
MRVIKTLAEQHPNTLLRTTFGTVQSMETDEATVCCEEEVSVRTSRTRECVKCHTMWRLRGISTKESFKKDTSYGSRLDLCVHVHQPCGVGHYRSDRLCLDRAKETAGSSTMVSILR